MASALPGDVPEERFARNGGWFTAAVGALVAAGLVVGWLLGIGEVPLWVPAASLLGLVIVWTSTLRPRVLVRDSELVLHNMLTTVHVPLATIEEVVVQQVLAVRAGERRFVCAGVGRSLRQVMKSSPMQRARAEVGGMSGEVVGDFEQGMQYADYVETRIRQLIREDRARRRITSVFSPEADELRRRIRREWAKPELVALVATSVLLLVALVVG